MDIVQSFYDSLAPQYDKLFLDWKSATDQQALMLSKLLEANGYDKSIKILDCACGIGTQAIGLAKAGYNVTASDISCGTLVEATKRAAEAKVDICFKNADFRALSQSFSQKFDVIIAMDNALPHMLTKEDLQMAAESIADRLLPVGMFVASIRDYDALLPTKPPYSAPYIHNTEKGQRISFQTWQWNENNYKLTQYIIEDDETLTTSKFECEYRAVTREELTNTILSNGFSCVEWKLPKETGFYQPILIAKK